jgi:uncharacterized protein (DUF169 family)
MKEDFTSTLRLLDEALARYVRPDTFPLAIRMLKPGEAIPEGVKIPSKTMGEQWIVCQSIGVARRYGCAIAVGKVDVICPLAAIAFGFRKPNDEYLRGFASAGMYCKDEQAAEIVIQTLTTNEPKVILPCTGDRVFGMAQDNEMAFAFPWRYAHEIIQGLEGTHKGGTRYPITVAMRDTVTMPSPIREPMKMLADRDAPATDKRD